ncbi:MAG: enoyl-CoA hydratase/isomerase family protein [Solirubrobacterales bacterium]
MPTLDRDGEVFILNLGAGENRLNPDWVGGVIDAFDLVERGESPSALVLSAEGKFWSNGLDLEWLAANADRANDFLVDVHELFARVLECGIPSVAAIQGHCFAAGAMLALAADERVMRADRGFFCLPEADIGIPFTPGMNDLLVARISQPTTHAAMVGARRYGGSDAVTAGLVDEAVTEDQVLPVALARARAQANKDPATRKKIKQRMYAPALATLRDREANVMPAVGG